MTKAWLHSPGVWNWPRDFREYPVSLRGVEVKVACLCVFPKETEQMQLWLELHESALWPRCQLSPAHLWQTVHLEGLTGSRSGWTDATDQRGNLFLGGSWQAGGGSGRTAGSERGWGKEEMEMSLSFLILQGPLNKNFYCLHALNKLQLHYK